MRPLRLAAVGWPVAVAAAFAGGLFLGPTRPAAAPEPAMAAPTAFVPVAAAAAPGLSAADVRSILREELADHAAAVTVEPSTALAVEPKPAGVEIIARSHETAVRGMADGRWTEQDRDALRGVIGGLTSSQLEEVFAPIILALNSGELQLDYVGPPL